MKRRRFLTALAPDELDELRRVAADPEPQDLEGLAYSVRWLLEERDRLELEGLLERRTR